MNSPKPKHSLNHLQLEDIKVELEDIKFKVSDVDLDCGGFACREAYISTTDELLVCFCKIIDYLVDQHKLENYCTHTLWNFISIYKNWNIVSCHILGILGVPAPRNYQLPMFCQLPRVTLQNVEKSIENLLAKLKTFNDTVRVAGTTKYFKGKTNLKTYLKDLRTERESLEELLKYVPENDYAYPKKPLHCPKNPLSKMIRREFKDFHDKLFEQPRN